MKTPFTVEQFLEVFRSYNEAVWPMQVFLYLFGVVIVALSIKKTHSSYKIITLVLAFLWLWMGIVYHLLYFSSINKAAYLFGAAFILQGFLIFYIGIIKKSLSFHFKTDIYGIVGAVFILYAIIIYPLVGYSLGHIYPASPTFGLPCPTTIFTFGVFLLSEKKVPWILVLIPFLWAIIGSTAVFVLGIKEDAGLLISAIITTTMVLSRNHVLKKEQV